MHTLDANAFHGNDIRTLSGSPGCLKKAGIVGWDSHSDNQGTANVENKNTPEDTTDGFYNVAAGTLSLRSSATMAQVSNRCPGG